MGTDKKITEQTTELRRKIEKYYLPDQLIDAILQEGDIPESPEEHYIGIAFLDIADYAYLSKFLTPRENQILLNGLYTSFYSILTRRKGYLNKIEGDSMMFHFGGPLDQNVAGLDLEKQLKHIARELFYTCIEMQRIAALFNQASDKFLDDSTMQDQKQSLMDAFAIIEALRSQGELTNSLNALFQIRIRIGASIGEVTAGNFGPMGARQWDVIGNPVILAKRMESTAPIGGLRITDEFFRVLDKYGYINSYCERIRKEALLFDSSYQNIRNDEIFQFHEVVIKEKGNARFKTYSVQVNPNIPRNIGDQIIALLAMDRSGAQSAVELMMHYRGNQYVIDELETCLGQMNVKIYKVDLLHIIFPKKYKELAEKYQEGEELEDAVNAQYSLYEIFELMGKYHDAVNQEPDYRILDETFTEYDEMMKMNREILGDNYKKREFQMVQRAHFYNIVMPLVVSSLKNSIMEYQASIDVQPEDYDPDVDDMEELESLEELDEA